MIARLLISRLTPAPLILIAILAAAQFAGSVPGQGEGGTIGGVVQDESGAPVAEVKVTIAAADFSSSMLTQADGRFEFKRLKPGQYTITAAAARFRKERVTVTLARADESLTQSLKLTPASLHLAVFDATTLPLGGVALILYSQNRQSLGAVAARAVTDESGDAYFGRLAPGSYQLTASLRGYDEYRSPVYISPDTTTDLPLQLLVAPVIPINEKAALRYNVPNLPSKNVQAILQDSDGWMWFGTDKGVAKFNGADFKSSATSGSPFEKLSGEDVRSIAEDQGGTVWLATSRGVRRVGKYGDDRGNVLDGVEARHVLVDSRGSVWIATHIGLFRFDGGGMTGFDRAQGLQSNDVRSCTEDASGKIWIAGAAGVSVLDGGRIIPFDRRIQTVSPKPGAATSEQAQGNSRPAAPTSRASATGVKDARAIFADRAGSVWLATSKGVLVFKDDRLSGVTIDALRNASLAPAADSNVSAIAEDQSGRMWFALESGGAVIFDPARNESQRVGYLDRDRVSGLLGGGEGMMWLATDNGAVRADLYSFVNFTASRGLADNDVRAVVEGPAGAGLWFVTAAGVSTMDSERFVPVERFRANFDVRAAAFDRSGAAWLATDQGVFKLSGQTLTQLNEGNGLPSNSINWVSAVAGGSEVIFASARGASVFSGGEVRPIRALAGYDIRRVFEDTDGRLWFSTSRGAVSFDPQTGNANVIDAARGLADNDTRWITRFDSRLIVATRAGVQVYDEGAENFTTFDGQPARSLFVDRDGYLWVGTDDGQVKKFGVAAGHLVSVVYAGETFGLSTNRINSISEDSLGQIWIATDKGAVRHVPLRSGPSARVWLEMNGRVEETSAPSPHYLAYGRRRLTFHFAAATQAGQVRYLYRIKGESGNEPWELLPVQLGAERDVAVFELDEGERTFEVIALNRDLYGAARPAAALALRIGAPFWKRWWFYAVAVTLAGLAAAAVFVMKRLRAREFVLPRELRTFAPIEPNPYIVGNPIRTEQMFFGREDDFRYVRTKLEGASQGVVIVFCGERRTGKSSILYQVLNGRLGERFIPVFVDMQEMVIGSDSEFFARASRLIAESVARALGSSAKSDAAETVGSVASPASPRVAGTQSAMRTTPPIVTVPEFDGRNPYPIFLDFLDEVLARIGDRTLLILMDEYELMESKVDDGKLSAEFFTFLAGLMDNKERLALIFTGSRRLEERDKKYWRELLRRSLFRKVSFLSQKDAVRLIMDPVEGRAVFGRGVVDAVQRLTAGQPFYTQVTCQNVVDYMNEHKQNWVTRADLEKVIADIVDNPLPQMIYTWDALSDDEKLVLSLLAEVLPGGDTRSTAHELRTSVRANEYPVNLSENTIRLTLEEMFRRELLDKDSAEGFSFKIDLLRLWIRRSHSIWQVVKEVRTL